MFTNTYTAQQNGEIAFASSFPGQILAINLTPGKSIIAQKKAFLACEAGVEMSVFFQKKFGKGLFGGEGLFNTVVTGPGKIVIQTMPISKAAGVIAGYIPQQSN